MTGLLLASTHPARIAAQQAAANARQLTPSEPSSIVLPLPEDRGQAAVAQALRRLGTTASVMMIVAHPDDEDGALLTYLSRGLGVRTCLLTLTRGEGGQNAMSADSYDALGVMRTNELLKADEYYGTKQLWGTEADFGFSKTQEEAFAKWGHDRVLYDAVLAVRRERPQVIVSTFVGGITDGHGHHQVSGEIAQEAFKAAADPNVFPEQLKEGLQPWQPLAVYSMVPFAPVTDKGMFDYATGKWAPARFKNYVTGEWIIGVPSTDVTMQVGERDPVLGRSYVQIAREGWGEQKSQNGGANPALNGAAETRYHLWAVPESAKTGTQCRQGLDHARYGPASLFQNKFVCIKPLVSGLSELTPKPPVWLQSALSKISKEIAQLIEPTDCCRPSTARGFAAIYGEALELRARIAASDLPNPGKSNLIFELDIKIGQLQEAAKAILGLEVQAFRANAASASRSAFAGRGTSADETPRTVTPGEVFRVQVRTSGAPEGGSDGVVLERTWLESHSGDPWKVEAEKTIPTEDTETIDHFFHVEAAANAEPTQPYFTRPNTEQPFYDLSDSSLRGDSFAPWPLTAWAEFNVIGMPIRVGQVVQTMQRVTGPGGIYEPLVVTPAIGVRMEPQARIIPLDGSALPVRVTVHTQAPAEGTVSLELPAGWLASPAAASFHRDSAGDTEPLLFSVTTDDAKAGAYAIQAVVHSGSHDYRTGWQSVGYAGLRPYNVYHPATLETRKVDVKLAPRLRVGYVMGTGDLVPEAIEGLGTVPHLLTPAELTSGDLSKWNVIVLGIRAYSARPELQQAQSRLDEFVRRGGTLVVEYQSSTFPAPLPLGMGRTPERVVDEEAPVRLLDPSNPLLTFPNQITAADFDGWVEERGHSFLDSWDPGYTALTETADPGQDPQRGGLLVAHPGKGTYVYVAFAVYRQLPELVPGAYRLLANLLSAGRESTK